MSETSMQGTDVAFWMGMSGFFGPCPYRYRTVDRCWTSDICTETLVCSGGAVAPVNVRSDQDWWSWLTGFGFSSLHLEWFNITARKSLELCVLLLELYWSVFLVDLLRRHGGQGPTSLSCCLHQNWSGVCFYKLPTNLQHVLYCKKLG